MSYTNGLDDPTQFFNTILYTGNSTARSLTGVGFQPDWVWIKSRSNTYHHELYDVVRGVQKGLNSNRTNAEETRSGLTSFDSDGFGLGTAGRENNNGDTKVAWNWKAGTSFSNDASATSIGSIDSSGSVSTDAGFSIISYTGTGSAGTIAHGLGLEPKMVITRNRDTATNWCVYSSPVGNTKSLFLNLDNAPDTATQYWNDTTPTSSVFSVGSNTGTNKSGDDFISYCFAEIKGYSKIGTYTGNGSTSGNFIYTGFKPSFVMTKRTSGTAAWQIIDTARNPINPTTHALFPNDQTNELGTYTTDYLSNGFNIQVTTASRNGNGDTYLFMAFAESPFVNSNGIPNNAR